MFQRFRVLASFAELYIGSQHIKWCAAFYNYSSKSSMPSFDLCGHLHTCGVYIPKGHILKMLKRFSHLDFFSVSMITQMWLAFGVWISGYLPIVVCHTNVCKVGSSPYKLLWGSVWSAHPSEFWVCRQISENWIIEKNCTEKKEKSWDIMMIKQWWTGQHFPTRIQGCLLMVHYPLVLFVKLYVWAHVQFSKKHHSWGLKKGLKTCLENKDIKSS